MIVIDPMDLGLAMSGVFRAVPLLPDSEKLGRIQVFTEDSAMLECAWLYRRTSAALRAVLVQTNSQGLDASIGFLGDTVQTHQQHPQYLGERVKTISTAELSAIITTLATVMRACSKPPELNFLSDSVFSIKVLQRQSRAVSNVELIQCGSTLVDQARRITQVTFQHGKAHSGLLSNEMADRVADGARKRVRIGATAPCLRPSVAGQGQELEQDHYLTHCISSEHVGFWLDVARCTDPKSVSHTKKSSKRSSMEVTFATANVLSLGENFVTRRRDPGLQISGGRAELHRIFHSTGLQVIGLQQCRAKKARRREGEKFYMISEPVRRVVGGRSVSPRRRGPGNGGQVEFRSNPVRRKLGQLTSSGGTTSTGEASLPGLEATMGAHDLHLVCSSICHVAGGRPQGDARSG